MTLDIGELAKFYQENHPDISAKLREAQQMSIEADAPDRILAGKPNRSLSEFSTIAGLDRDTHLEEINLDSLKQKTYEDFLADIQPLGERYVVSIASGVRRLLRMPDLHSPKGELQPISEGVSGFYRHRTGIHHFIRNDYAARMLYVRGELHENVSVYFKQTDDEDIGIQRVLVNSRILGDSSGMNVLYKCNQVRLESITYNWDYSDRNARRAVFANRTTPEFATVFTKFFGDHRRRGDYNDFQDLEWLNPRSGRTRFILSQNPVLNTYLKGSYTPVESQFKYSPKDGDFRRSLKDSFDDNEVSRLKNMNVSALPQITLEEFAILYKGVLLLTPLV